jgi:protein SCO1/2
MIKKYGTMLFAVMLLIATGVFWHLRGEHETLLSATAVPAEALPNFELITTQKTALTPQNFRGQWTFLFFGYTHCPDICPAMMARLQKVATLLEPNEAQVVFISADPLHDSFEDLDHYVHHYSPNFIGATGLPAEVNSLAKALHLYFSNADGNDEPKIDHSDALLLINPNAELVAIFVSPTDPNSIVADLRTLKRRVQKGH